MDIIENWNFLNSRMKEENSEIIPELMQVHMESFNDLRKSGYLLSMGDKKISEIAPTISPEERLQLIGAIGNSLVKRNQNDLFSWTMNIDLADAFPNCIFIAIAAILENLEGGINLVLKDKKMVTTCIYSTTEGADDPLGKLLPLLSKIFSWVDIVCKKNTVKAPEPQVAQYADVEKAHTVIKVESVTKIDVMRTAFTGVVAKGEIKTGDTLIVTDGKGQILCNEGVVLLLVTDKHPVSAVKEQQRIDEMLVAVEIPKGTYNGLLLIDGKVSSKNKTVDEKTEVANSLPKEENKEDSNEKSGLFSFLKRKFKK